MSISGSQEVKTALLEASAAAGTTETAQLDAQEDREILGWHESASLDESGAAPGVSQVRSTTTVGTDQSEDPAAGNTSQQDNLSWHRRSRYVGQNDDTNGTGGHSGQTDGEWYGHGSGIEWNEDATLSHEVQSGGGGNSAHLTVYYREL